MPKVSEEDWKRQAQKKTPRNKPKHKKKPKKKQNEPKSSAQVVEVEKHQNLTLHDWMTVYAYIDLLPKPINQGKIVKHFRTRKEGALIFTQSTLSRKLKDREEMEQRVVSFPNALSSKRPRVVTRPDIDRALFLWVKHMAVNGNVVNSYMLAVKREFFENEFLVPDEERLTGNGWLQSFCNAYQLRRICLHGEAGSIDEKTVREEQLRIRELLARFPIADRWNVDESALFAFAPPDRGLAQEQMSGKKANKFRLTLCFACNADGSEKREIFFIGKSKQPRCFGSRGPNERGYYYRNNKTAWMTEALFEEWIKRWDFELQAQNRTIALTLDNFSGHIMQYRPKCITMIYFEPGLTPFVQPLDAGIIRCFKAHYRREFCRIAIERDDADERDIYKIDLLTAMIMAKEAWKSITSVTIRNCWDHTAIQRPSLPIVRLTRRQGPIQSTPETLALGWDIIVQFASEDWTLPEVHERLAERLGNRFNPLDWNEPIDAVLSAENDVEGALEALRALRIEKLGDESPEPLQGHAETEQSAVIEKELQEMVDELKKRRRIAGVPLSIEELVDPVEERTVGELSYKFDGGDAEIVAYVRNNEMAIDEGSDSDIDEPETPKISVKEIMSISRVIEDSCVELSDDYGPALAKMLRLFRGELQKGLTTAAEQTTLDKFFKKV